MKRRLAVGVSIAVGLYLFVILLGGLFAGGCVEGRLEARLARALAADVDIGETSVFIATGRVTLHEVSIRRDGVEIDIDEIEVTMPGGGLMLFSRTLETVIVREARVALSARGAVDLARREREPVHIERLVLRDASFTISPTLIVPGLGRLEAVVASAVSRDVDLASAMSWIADLDEMVAAATLPAGASAGIEYRDGKLDLSGRWFGSGALSLPFTIPEMGPGLLEVEQLTVIGKALLKAVAKHVAKDKLLDAARDLFD